MGTSHAPSEGQKKNGDVPGMWAALGMGASPLGQSWPNFETGFGEKEKLEPYNEIYIY